MQLWVRLPGHCGRGGCLPHPKARGDDSLPSAHPTRYRCADATVQTLRSPIGPLAVPEVQPVYPGLRCASPDGAIDALDMDLDMDRRCLSCKVPRGDAIVEVVEVDESSDAKVTHVDLKTISSHFT